MIKVPIYVGAIVKCLNCYMIKHMAPLFWDQ